MNSPYIGKFRVSQQYKGSAHDGLDLVGVDSKEIHSTVNGVVERAGWENPSNHSQGFGQYVRIKQNGTDDRYYFGHLSEVKVKVGQQVKITDEQHDELTETARNTSDVQYSVDVLTKLEELDKRLTVLEKSDGDTSGEDTAEYPEYVVGKWYHNGEKCSFKGVNYVCIAPEVATCVWGPKDYPAYWEEEDLLG